MATAPAYAVRRAARSRFAELRGLSLHLLEWGDRAPERATLVMLHGWMDVAASFQFVVDAFASERHVLALDWRGFGRSAASGADSYWFPDYLGDLECVLDLEAPDRQVDLLGHSMGGNIAMIYAGVRPARVRRLVNLEGFGMPATLASQAPARYARWLDELKVRQALRDYASLDEVAERLRRTNPRLAPEKAAWLAPHWSARHDDGRWHVLGDAAHKRVNPQLYQKDEVLACWKRIEAPLLWVEGADTDTRTWWGERYTRAEFEARLAVVPALERARIEGSAHMLHHDQPEAVARVVEAFLDRPP